MIDGKKLRREHTSNNLDGAQPIVVQQRPQRRTYLGHHGDGHGARRIAVVAILWFVLYVADVPHY